MAVAEHRFRVMASTAHVVVVDGPPGVAVEAQRLLELLEHRWSRFLPHSDISRLNASPGRPVPVAPETLVLLDAMVRGWRATGGRYDPTVLPHLVAAGYAVSREDPERCTTLPPDAVGTGALDDVVVDRERATATVPPGTALDPGGVGKGLAADLAVDYLRDRGAAGALVGIGGDLAMGGTGPDASGWAVAVERPDPADPPLATLVVAHGGVATSSTRSRRWEHQGRRFHHAIDPATGEPSGTDLVTVTVVAPTGWEAEVHATAALLAGSGGVLAHLAAHGLSGLASTGAGEVVATDDLGAIATMPLAGAIGGSR